MASFGKVIELEKELKNFPHLEIVFKYLNDAIRKDTEINRRIMAYKVNEHQRIILSKNIFAIEQSYNTKEWSEELFFESHVKYVDIQCIIYGEEMIEVKDIDLLTPKTEYNKEDDYTLYDVTTKSSKLILSNADIGIFFPRDGHMPGMKVTSSSQVFKTVVKVPYKFF